MPKKRRDLPEPPSGPFGRRRGREGEGGEAPQTADRLAMAVAQGRLDEFLEEEFDDIPGAKELAMMMLGATGMAPPGKKSEKAGKSKKARGKKKPAPAKAARKGRDKGPEIPEELLEAAGGGDIEGISALLSGELRKGRGGGGAKREKAGVPKEALFEKGDIDTLMKVAAENNVSLDWVLSRAIKLYARDYRNTGRI